MNPQELIRSAPHIHDCLEELPDGRVIAKKQVKIYSPYRYLEKKLISIGEDVYILGIFGITTEDKYLGVSLLTTMVAIDPSNTERVKIDGDDYFEFTFNPGATVFKYTTLVKTDALIYSIYDEFLAKGYVPWYMSYDDLGKLFDSAAEFSGANVGKNQDVSQLIASIVSRDPNDRTVYFRTTVNSAKDLMVKKPVFVGLKSVEYSASNTTSRLGGSYFQIGVTSALINPSSRKERVESLLLK